MARVLSSDQNLYLGTMDDPTTVIGHTKDFTLTLDKVKVDVTTLESDDWANNIGTTKMAKVTFNALLDYALTGSNLDLDALFGHWNLDTELYARVGGLGSNEKYFAFRCKVLNLEKTAETGGVVTFKGELESTGAVTINDGS